MDDHNDFDNVSWRNDAESESSRPNAAEPPKALPTRNTAGKRSKDPTQALQAGQFADPVDLAGVGDGVIECTVDTPLKENDGTKDAHISYLVTTHVRRPLLCHSTLVLTPAIVGLSNVSEAYLQCPPPLHRFCVSQKYVVSELLTLRRSSSS